MFVCFVVSAVEVFVNYGGVHVFHVCVVECCWYLVSGCFLLCSHGVVEYCESCLICDACSCRSFMGSVCISSCKCWVLVSAVHPVAILNAYSVLYVVC